MNQGHVDSSGKVLCHSQTMQARACMRSCINNKKLSQPDYGSACTQAFVDQQQKAMSQPDYVSACMHVFVHQQQKAMSQPDYVSARTHAFVNQQHMTLIIAMTCKQKTAARRENDCEELLPTF